MDKRLFRPAMLTLIVALLGALPVHAQQPVQSSVTSLSPGSPVEHDAASPSYRLRSGDVVELNFPFVPTFNQTLTVEPDGYITLHALGPLRVAGLTVPELMQTVRTEYTAVLRDPVVTAQLRAFQRPYFIVAGEVIRPGKYDLRGDTTVTQAVAIAGGLREHAKTSEAVVFHPLPGGGVETAMVDLKQIAKQALLGADPRLASGDMLLIPRGSTFKVTEWLPALWILGIFY